MLMTRSFSLGSHLDFKGGSFIVLEPSGLSTFAAFTIQYLTYEAWDEALVLLWTARGSAVL